MKKKQEKMKILKLCCTLEGDVLELPGEVITKLELIEVSTIKYLGNDMCLYDFYQCKGLELSVDSDNLSVENRIKVVSYSNCLTQIECIFEDNSSFVCEVPNGFLGKDMPTPEISTFHNSIDIRIGK